MDAIHLHRLIVNLAMIVPLIAIAAGLNHICRARAARNKVSGDVIVCRPAWGWVFFYFVLGIALFANSVWTAMHMDQLASDRHQWMILAFAVNPLLVIYLILGVLKYRIVLTPDSITLKGIFVDRCLKREEITAYYPAGWVIRLRPKKNVRKWVLNVATWYDRQNEIKRWLTGIPNLMKGEKALQ